MLEYLSQDLRDHLALAQSPRFTRKQRLRAEVGAASYPVIRQWASGFSLDATLSPRQLRGLVDLYEGSRHVLQCLIVASELEGDELRCEFKRATRVASQAALDYWRDENAPIAYLPKG